MKTATIDRERAVVEMIREAGTMSTTAIAEKLGWERQRIGRALQLLECEGSIIQVRRVGRVSYWRAA